MSHGINDLNFIAKEIEILNEDRLMESKFELIHNMKLYGLNIDRETNSKRNFDRKKMSDSYHIYVADDLTKVSDAHSLIQLYLKIETRTKINIIDHDNNHLIQTEDRDKPETHFLKFECTSDVMS